MGRVSPVLAGRLKLAMFAIAMKRLDFPRLALHPCARSHQFARQANLLPVRTNDNAPSHRVYGRSRRDRGRLVEALHRGRRMRTLFANRKLLKRKLVDIAA